MSKQLLTCHRKDFKLIDKDIWEVQIDGKHSHYENSVGESKNGESPLYPSYEMLVPNADIRNLPPKAQHYAYGTEFSPKILKQRHDIPTDPTNIVQTVQDLVNERDHLKAQIAELTERNKQLQFTEEEVTTGIGTAIDEEMLAQTAAKLVQDRMEDEYDFSEGERSKFVGTNAKERWRVTFDWDGNAGDKSEHWGFKNEKKAQNFINKLMDKYSAYKFENVEITSYTISEAS